MVEKGKIRNIGVSKCVIYSIGWWLLTGVIISAASTFAGAFAYSIQNTIQSTGHRIQNLAANPLNIKAAVNQVIGCFNC
jgi:hypothetical protein